MLQLHCRLYFLSFLYYCAHAGGLTLLLKSDGPAKKNQPNCLGVYRMVDYHNGKPVYRQDVGDYYLYFLEAKKCWMFGEFVGSSYNHRCMK